MKIKVVAHVNSKKVKIDEDLTGTLHVYVNEPALENRANRAIIKLLAKQFKLKQSSIFLSKGLKSRVKEFEII